MFGVPFLFPSSSTTLSTTLIHGATSIPWLMGIWGIVQLCLQALALGVSHGLEPLQWRTLLSIKAIGGPLPKVYPPFMIGFVISHGILLGLLAWCVYQGESHILPWFQKAQWLEWLPWLVMMALVIHSGTHFWEALQHKSSHTHHHDSSHEHAHGQGHAHKHQALQSSLFKKGMSHILGWFQASATDSACTHFGGGTWFKPALLIGFLWGLLPCPITVSAFLSMTAVCHGLIHSITHTSLAHHPAWLATLTHAQTLEVTQVHFLVWVCLGCMVVSFLLGVTLAYTLVLFVGTQAGQWCMVRLRWWKHKVCPSLNWEQFSLGIQFGCWLLLALGLFIVEFAPLGA